MPCLVLVIGIAFPRLVLALLFFFTTYLNPVFHGFLIPLLGFIFLPLTTLIYAVIINSGHQPAGLYLFALVICALADLGLIGHGASRRND